MACESLWFSEHRTSRIPTQVTVKNADAQVVEDFGSEWSRFTQAELSERELTALFEGYFAVFPWSSLPDGAEGADVGCGSGRWAMRVAARVGVLHCVDASAAALEVARRNCRDIENVRFHIASADELPFAAGTLDFAYSLGVLHHVPDTAVAIKSVVRALKGGAPLLLYLYYAFDNRPWWFKWLWRGSDAFRRLIARLPVRLKQAVCDVIAVAVYWPLARVGLLLERTGRLPQSWPLSAYRHRSFYVMRTDALDRFGTRLEQRFTRRQIRDMMEAAGLKDIKFSDALPYWCAVGFREHP